MAAAVENLVVSTTVADEDDQFAEDECTIDFGEEDDGQKSRAAASSHLTLQQRHLMYCHIPGEDFSKYLEDDDDNPYQRTHPVANLEDAQQSTPSLSLKYPTPRRYRKRSEQLTQPTETAHPKPAPTLPTIVVDEGDDSRRRGSAFTPTPFSPPQQPANDATASRGKSIRERLGRFLPTMTTKSKQRQSKPTGSVYDFTFADSKMASEYFCQRSQSLTPSSSSSTFETHSDLGTYESSSRPGSSWWNVGTLSAARSGGQMSPSSGTSISGSTASRKIKNGDNGKPLARIFQRRNRAHSVPNLQSFDKNDCDASSAISGSSISNGVEVVERANSNNNSSSAKVDPANAQGSSAVPSLTPPPLPPLRQPHVDNEAGNTRDGRSSSSKRFSDFWQKLADRSSRSVSRSREPVAETSGIVPKHRAEPVSTLRYKRTYEEIPVKF